MASSKGTKPSTTEKSLKNAIVHVSKMHQRNTVQNIVLSWRVSCYEQLECSILYFQLYESPDIECELRLFKKEDSLYLCVFINSPIPKQTKAEFLITSEITLKTVTSEAQEIAEGLFVTQFHNKKFLDPNLLFLKDGILTISFKYVSGYRTSCPDLEYSGADSISDLDDLCYDLRNMYLEALHWDFLIHVKNYSFKTHKFVLAGRSVYFEMFFESNKDAADHELDTLPGIMHEVLLYIYSVEFRETSFDCTLKMYELAFLLDIESLCLRCLEYFKKAINKDNYMVLSRFCIKAQYKDLRNLVAHFLKKHCPELKIMNVFMQAVNENIKMCTAQKGNISL